MSSRRFTLSPLIELPTATTAVWRMLGVHLFRGKLTLDDMDVLDEQGAMWRKTMPGKTVELVVIFPSDAQMTSDERKRMAQLIKRWENERLASSTVVLAEGLVGSLHRSILTGLQMLVPSPHPVKVFGTIAPAVTWLAPYAEKLCGPEAKAEALLAAVDEMIGRFLERLSS